MTHRAHLFFPHPEATADAIARALAPEASQAEVPKTRGDVRAGRGGVEIMLTAEDLPSLRATVNSHLRWVDAAAKAAALGQTGIE